MPRKGENIYKRKDGRWEGRYIKERIDDKVRYGAVYARSYREVKEKLNAVKLELKKTQAPVLAGAGTVSAISTEWLNNAARSLKEASLIKYEDLLRCYILPEFGECELSEITNEQLINFGNKLLMEGGIKKQGLSPSTVLEVMSAMNSIRIHAMRRDCGVAFSTECVNIKRNMGDIRVFTMGEEKKLIAYLCTHMDLTSLAILLCLFTGIRIGEVCALNWNDFDLEQGMLRICKTMQRIRDRDGSEDKTIVKIFEPKSERSIRTIPLPSNIITLLRGYYKSGSYFLTGDREKFVEPRTLQYRFKSILSKCGIEDANFHTTRHTFATRCVEQGFDVKCLSEILGHASVSITLNRYVHPSMSLKSENMMRLSDLFPITENIGLKF